MKPWLLISSVVGCGLLLFSGSGGLSNMIRVPALGGRVQMAGGSTPANLQTLQTAFPAALVVDLGGGVYLVTTAQATTASVPGAKVL